MEQLVARRAHNQKVVGSSPAPATQVSKKPLREIWEAFLFDKTHKVDLETYEVHKEVGILQGTLVKREKVHLKPL